MKVQLQYWQSWLRKCVRIQIRFPLEIYLIDFVDELKSIRKIITAWRSGLAWISFFNYCSFIGGRRRCTSKVGNERRTHLRFYPGCGRTFCLWCDCEYVKMGFRPATWDLYRHLLYRVSISFCCRLPRSTSPLGIDSRNSHCFRWDYTDMFLKSMQRLKIFWKRIHCALWR